MLLLLYKASPELYLCSKRVADCSDFQLPNLEFEADLRGSVKVGLKEGRRSACVSHVSSPLSLLCP